MAERITMSDLAIRRLSYSSLLTLHKCPRRFYLERHDLGDREESVHLSYGKAFGTGIQEVMKGSSMQDAIFAAFLAWTLDTEEEIEKDKKSLWFAIIMIQKFAEEHWPVFQAAGWELLLINKGTDEEKATDEYGFKVNFFDGFYLIGFIDAVLYNKHSHEIKVLEIKTTKYSNVSEALYANSWQALGYNVILDSLAKELGLNVISGYEVLYLVLKSSALEIEVFPFQKSSSKKAIWLKDITLDIERIKGYEEDDHWPMYGESCYDYAAFKPCKYFTICHMSLRGIFLKTVEQINEEIEKKEIKEEEQSLISTNISIEEIISTQLGDESK